MEESFSIQQVHQRVMNLSFRQIYYSLLVWLILAPTLFASNNLLLSETMVGSKNLGSNKGQYFSSLHADGKLALIDTKNLGGLAFLSANETVWQTKSQPQEASTSISHIGTSKLWDSNGKGLVIERPKGSRTGDLLMLFLHRTDDYLPLSLPGWIRVAECLKGDNGMDCAVEQDCKTWLDKQYCERFNNGSRGLDLAQAVFIRTVESNEPESYELNLKSRRIIGGHPSWVFLSVFRGANNADPIRDWAHTGCDRDRDSRFPSVNGRKNDLILLSQSFDDAEPARRFRAPLGTTLLAHIGQSDESGFLFAGTLDKDGETGILETQGDGAFPCKDALVSLVLRPKASN